MQPEGARGEPSPSRASAAGTARGQPGSPESGRAGSCAGAGPGPALLPAAELRSCPLPRPDSPFPAALLALLQDRQHPRSPEGTNVTRRPR